MDGAVVIAIGGATTVLMMANSMLKKSGVVAEMMKVGGFYRWLDKMTKE